MFVPFDLLPDHSRIWIYQSDKKLSASQKDIISSTLKAFTEQWQVHGMPMDASFEIRHDHFVILAANDQASGCSIDTSVRTIQNIGEKLGIDFFNRSIVAFKESENIILVNLKELKTANENKHWDAETPAFNNIVATKGELKTQWMVPAGATWLKRYLTKFSSQVVN